MEANERVKAVRELLGLSTRALADALGVSPSVITEWESGRSSARKPNALALQALYGINWEWIMTGEGPMRVPLQSPSLQTANSFDVPIFNGLPCFEPGGERVDSAKANTFQRMRLASLDAHLASLAAGSLSTLALVRIPHDEDMQPTLTPGGLVLVNTARPLRLCPPQNSLVLLDFDGEGTPCFRRVLGPVDPDILTMGTENPVQKARTHGIGSELDHYVVGVALF